MKNINLLLEFGGFYHSIHDENISHAVEILCDDDEGNFNQDEYDNIDFKSVFLAYSKEYIEKFNEWLNDEFETDVDLKFISLDSPKYYNYSTDKIEIELTTQDGQKINNLLTNDADFLEYLKDRTTSCSGFISFYSFDDAMNDKDNTLTHFTLAYLATKYNNEALTCSIYEINVFETIADAI